MKDILVPISPGELLDKITILRIKSARMTDPAKLANVRHELVQLETEILAAGSKGFFEKLRADPKAFERGVIDRFYDDPVRIAPYGD